VADERDFTWIDGERLIRYRRGAVEEAGLLLAERGFEGYALLTTERALGAAPELANAAATVLHVPHGGVPDAAAEVRDRVGGRPLVGFGGGRVIDSAKAIAGADGLRCAAIPTTLSGAELTRIHRMPAGVERFNLVRPSLVVADPALTASQPMPELAASAMNALGHAIEALYTPFANPIASLAGLKAAELIAAGLADEEPDGDLLALGSLLGAYALGLAGYAVHHVVCQTLVRVAGTPHAETNAVMLPHSVGLMASRAPEAIGRLAGALGALEEDPAEAAGGIRPLAARAGVTRLSDLEVDEALLPEVAVAASERAELANTPEPPKERELLELLRSAL
jgi:alcohol dehydrogenase class IV